jgi:uncharacterized protein (DUF1778 family)
MARLTVRLPDSLHETLARRAEAEGVSMNQFLVYALTQVTALDLAAQQRARFEALRTRVPEEEAEDALRELLDARAP